MACGLVRLISWNPSVRFTGQHATISEYLCSSDEKIAPCLRNWWNALANIFTGIVAIIAAMFAYNQYLVARAQTNLNLIPVINTQIAQRKRLHQAITAGVRAYLNLLGNLDNVFFLLSKGAEEDTLRPRAVVISGYREDVEKIRADLLTIENEVDLEAVYRDTASEVRGFLSTTGLHDVRQMIDFVVRFAEGAIHLRQRDMVLAEDHANRAIPHMRNELRRIQEKLRDAEAWIETSMLERERIITETSN